MYGGRGEKAPLLFGRRSDVDIMRFDNVAYDDSGFDASGKDVGRTRKPDAEKLGTILGCTIPVLQNIIGIVLFLRLPWALGQVI